MSDDLHLNNQFHLYKYMFLEQQLKPLCPLFCVAFHVSDVKLDIYNYEEVKPSSNVMGFIRGSVEPGETKVGSAI